MKHTLLSILLVAAMAVVSSVQSMAQSNTAQARAILDKTSKAYQVYGTENISERHRHRYEVNNDYRTALTEHGMKLCGTSPDGRIVEMIEIPEHPWFIATQAHPELKSRPNRPHPLFKGFIEASLKNKVTVQL